MTKTPAATAKPATGKKITTGLSSASLAAPAPRRKMTLADAERVKARITSADLKKSFAIPKRQAVTKRLDSYAMKNAKWLLQDRIPLGEITLIVGDPATLKTTVALGIVAASTVGGRWAFDEAPVKRGSWIWIGVSENSPSKTLLPRVLAAGGDPHQVRVLEAMQDDDGTSGFALSIDMEQLRRVIDDRCSDDHDVVGIVLDPLNEFLGAGVDSWKDDAVRRVLGPLAALAEEKQLGVIGIMHPRKSGDAHRMLTNIIGSISFGALARSVLFTKRDEDEDGVQLDQCLLLCEKASLATATPLGLVYEAADKPLAARRAGDEDVAHASYVRWIATTEKRLKEMMTPKPAGGQSSSTNEVKQWLEGFLGDGQPKDAKDIYREADLMGYSEGMLQRASRALGVDKKQSGFHGGWQWSLVPRPPPDEVVDFGEGPPAVPPADEVPPG